MSVQSLRALIADNGTTETGMTLRALCANHEWVLELVFVSNWNCLLHSLLQINPHVAFLSLGLLQPDPPGAVLLLHQSVPSIPLILFALPADKDRAAECLKSGAKDYMLEGYMDGPTLDRVLHAATHGTGTTSSSAIPRSLRDSLTNLPNRSGLLTQVQHSLQESPLSDSCMIFSINLKDRKSRLIAAGKPFVERALQQVAQRLVRCVRRSDLVAHVSRGMFVLVVSNINEAALPSLQRRMETALLPFGQHQSNGLPLYFSIQSSAWRNSSPYSFREILFSHLAPRRRALMPPLVPAIPGFSSADAWGNK